MSRFNIGDKVIGNRLASKYNVTRTGWIGVVRKTRDDVQDIFVEGVDDGQKWWVESMCFDLYKGATKGTCAICGATRKIDEMKSSDRDGKVCKRCYQKTHTHCDTCGREIHKENSYIYEAKVCCKSCVSNILSSKGVKIYSYHSFNDWKLYKNDNEKDVKYYIGAEIETEAKGNSNETAVLLAMQQLNAIAMRDGSLYSGVEIITHPETMAYKESHKGNYKKFFEMLQKYNYGNNGRAGLHFHVTRPTDDVIARLFVILESFKDEIIKLSRRDTYNLERWAPFISTGASGLRREKYKSEKFIKEDYLQHSHDRYNALNLCNAKTIEFRFFDGANNFEEYWSALQFINNLMKQATSKKRLNEIKWGDLIKGDEIAKEAQRLGLDKVNKKVMDTTKIIEKLEKEETKTRDTIKKLLENYIKETTKRLEKTTFKADAKKGVKDLMNGLNDFTSNIRQQYQRLDNVYYIYRNVNDYSIDNLKETCYIPSEIKDKVAKEVDDFNEKVKKAVTK